jgi:6-phosphofructokinase
VTSAARSVRRYGGIPYMLSGGYSTILSQETKGIYEITQEIIDRWEHQEFADFVIDRSLPNRSDKELTKILEVLKSIHLSRMIVIGGNGSSFALSALYRHAPCYFDHLVQILKTMDGDCQNPFWNLGFASTLFHAEDMLNRFSNETSIYGSPYIVKVMGREVGQLAFHLGLNISEKSKGLILIREELGERKLTTEQLTKLLVASSLKKIACHGSFGPLVVSEGIIDCLTSESQEEFGVKFDRDGRTNFAGANLEGVLRDRVSTTLKALGVSSFGTPLQVGARCIGYESRSGSPVGDDTVLAVEYGNRAGNLAASDKPLLFPTLLRRNDEIDLRNIINEEGVAEQCWVDTSGPEYQRFIANQYRMYPADLYGDSLERIAGCQTLPANELRQYLMEAANLFACFRKGSHPYP